MKPKYFLPPLLLALLAIPFLLPAKESPELPYSEFKAKVRSGDIRRVELADGLLRGFPAAEAPGKKSSEEESARAVAMEDPALLPLLDSMGAAYSSRPGTKWGPLGMVAAWVFPLLLMMGLLRLIALRGPEGGGGLMTLGKSRAHAVSGAGVGVTFEDVAGVDEAKEELAEVIDFLKRPERYAAIGGHIPKGVLLVGPPGTGKTLLAKAVAGEAQVPFFEISGAEFVEMIVGVGAARVRDMFLEARKQAPCILFIDELDAIGKSRGNSAISNDEREQTLNQLLVEMQGFDSRSGVIVLAATNRPDVLDPALLRPGRFDRHILVDRPDLEGREAILRKHAAKVAMGPAVDLKEVARKTPGFVGADLANVINEAALLAVRGGRERVEPQDVEEAIEKSVSGLKKKSRLITPREKELVAFHEAGHAVAAAYTPGADPVAKISIIPRGMGTLGFTQQIPDGDKHFLTEADLLAQVDVALGGRAAEQLMFGEISTGASDDLSRATETVRRMLVEFGMGAKYRDVALHVTRREPSSPWPWEGGDREMSESTRQYVDEEIARIIAERRGRVDRLVASHRGLLLRIARELVAVETVTGKRMRELAEAEEGTDAGDPARLPVVIGNAPA
jgi:cell division protease FtsH